MKKILTLAVVAISILASSCQKESEAKPANLKKVVVADAEGGEGDPGKWD